MSCNHSLWLRTLRSDSNVLLEYSDRPQRILSEVNHHAGLSIVAVIGNQDKSQALARLLKEKQRPMRGHGEVHLLTSSLRDRADRSIMIADVGRPHHNRLPSVKKAFLCHVSDWSEKRHLLGRSAAQIASALYRESLLPHVDAICLFVADLGGPTSAMRVVRSWFDGERFTTSPVRPYLVLMVNKSQRASLQKIIRQMRSSINFTESFLKIRIVTDQASSISSTRKMSRFYRVLFDACNASYEERKGTGYLFSARQTIEFLSISVRVAEKGLKQPFDFVKASRETNDLDSDQERHLLDILMPHSVAHSIDAALPVIASSFILDHYPPGMHLFDPKLVFRTLYREPCRAIEDRRQSDLQLPGGFVQTIETHMIRLFDRFKTLGSSKALHQEQLKGLSEHTHVRSSHQTCCYCMRRDFHRMLPCGHAICHTCVRIFYPKLGTQSHVHEVHACLICGLPTGGLRVGLKPDTASVRVLSIDGGGSRARLPLEFLLRLQHCIGIPYPVQFHFDVAIGTSSGAMALCAMFLNGWPIELCIRYLDVAARFAFQKPLPLRLFSSLMKKYPLLTNLVEFLLSLWNNSKYSADKLERIQKDAYGVNNSLTDSKVASEAGVMLGVTLTGTRDTRTFVATNYNSCGGTNPQAGYTILKPERGISSIPVWEILRCCTAAPYYFTAHHIEGCGTFQDGGLAYNNPAPIALKEAETMYPTAGKPSIFASFGTGFDRDHGKDTGGQPIRPSTSRQGWEEWYPVRCLRALLNLSNSKTAWEKFEHTGSDGFFRFDVEFDKKSPPLDEVYEIDRIGRLGREAAAASLAVEDLAKRIRAELFIFELDTLQLPRFTKGYYYCVGNLYCRLSADSPELRALLSSLHGSSALFMCQNNYLNHDFWKDSVAGNFCKKITFRVANRQAELDVRLKETPEDSHRISGSPFTLDRLIKQQALESWFGAPDHRKRQQQDISEPDAKRKRLNT